IRVKRKNNRESCLLGFNFFGEELSKTIVLRRERGSRKSDDAIPFGASQKQRDFERGFTPFAHGTLLAKCSVLHCS
ncbi:hypothetical protein, partial [Xenorhabdus szentirmaii]|uniref:hypothetical protein n=1 Tax=Xenorhabdus szentirmaii TaxID=290112 RepID=UPI002B41013A